MSRLEQLPEFKNEDEEFEFWSTADSTEYLDPAGWRQVPPPSIAGNDDTIFLRMPHALTQEVERLSREKMITVDEMVLPLVAAGLTQQRVQPGLYLMSKYEIIIYWSEQDDRFIAEVLELPGCLADGKTYEECLQQAQDETCKWIGYAREIGGPIPEPKGRLMNA